jgi:hypothetical protein
MLGTVPSRTRRCSGHSSQQEQEVHLVQIPAGTRNKWGSVLNRNKGHLGNT